MLPARRSRRDGVQRRRHAAHSAELEIGAVPRWSRKQQRPGRQEPDVPPDRVRAGSVRRTARQPQRTAGVLHPEQAVLRDRPVARLRARLQHADRARLGSVGHRDGRLRQRHDSVGSRTSRGIPPTVRSRRVDRHPLRGSAGGTQHRDARSDARRFERHPGAEDHVPLQRQQSEDDGTRAGARRRMRCTQPARER